MPFQKALDTAIGFIDNGSIVGWTENSEISSHYFVIFQDTKTLTSVRARIIDYSISGDSQWESKFENSNGDNRSMGIAGLTQQGQLGEIFKTDALNFLKGKTLITKAQSTQVWAGDSPMEVSIEVEFFAFRDAYKEVELPILKLMKMKSPELHGNIGDTLRSITASKKSASDGVKGAVTNAVSTLGDVPNAIDIDFMGRNYRGAYRLESISVSSDELRLDKNGNRIQATVSLQFGSFAAISKSDIKDGSLSSIIGDIKSLLD